MNDYFNDFLLKFLIETRDCSDLTIFYLE